MVKKIKNIEAEGSEIILRNENSNDIVIIPKYHRDKVLKMLNNNDHSGIDEIVSTLPSMQDYAADGTLIFPDGEPDEKKSATVSNQIEEEQGIDWNQVIPMDLTGTQQFDSQNVSENINSPGLNTGKTSPKLYWKSVPAALSRYKMLKQEGKDEEANKIVFGHFDPSKYSTPYTEGTHSESEQKGLIRPVRATDLPLINKEYRSLIPDYNALSEGTMAYGGKIKAQDGLEIPGNPPSTKEVSGIYNAEDVQGLRERYGSGQMATFAEHGCLGSTCRNMDALYPNVPSYYKELEEAGVFQGKGISTSFQNLPEDRKKKASGANTLGVDSWELPYVLEDYKLGKQLFGLDPDKADSDFVRNYDYTKLPVGTILSSGNAKGVYVDPDAKSYRGKDEPLYRHSVTVVGYTEGQDLEGNPTVDILIDENGNLKRVGKSKDAEYSWSDYSTGKAPGSQHIYGATVRNSTKDLTYDYFASKRPKGQVEAQKQEKLKKDFIKEAENIEADLVSGKIKKGTLAYTTAMSKLKTLDKYREQQ